MGNYRYHPSRVKKYGPRDMSLAMKAVENGMPLKTAASKFKVPRSTLRQRLSEKSQHQDIQLQEIQSSQDVVQIDQPNEMTQSTTGEQDIRKKAVEFFESKLDPDLLKAFRTTKEEGNSWNGEEMYKGAYYIWKDMKFDMGNQIPEASPISPLPRISSGVKCPDVPDSQPGKKRGRDDGMPRVEKSKQARQWIDLNIKTEEVKKRLEQERAERMKRRRTQK